MERVFVSHSHADNRMVATFVRDLWGAGVDVWVDLQDIAHGQFLERIDQALETCAWFVIVMTNNSLKSEPVRTEVRSAMGLVWKHQMKGMIPFVGADCDEKSIPPTWQPYHRFDAVKDGYVAAFQGLLQAIGKPAVAPLSIRESGQDVKGIPEASDAIVQEVRLHASQNAPNMPGAGEPAHQTPPQPVAPISEARLQAGEVHELVRDGRWLTAVTIAEEAVHKPENQQDAALWGDYGLALIKTGERKKGIETLVKAAQLGDDRAELWNLRAQALADDGDLPGAIVAWKTAFRRSTADGRLAILSNQYQAQMKAKDAIGARQTCQQADELAPNNVDWQRRMKDAEMTIRILPASLQEKGFTAQARNGVEIIVPPMVTIPKGAFLMGSDKQKDSQASDGELPQHSVILEEYAIGTYPLTVAEYACFVRAAKHRVPRDWQAQLQKQDHPVVNVSWHDILAYVRWLAEVTKEPYRMPTEAEWEKAARGTDGRIYPWGNAWDKTRVNTNDGGPGGTTPVESYPQGESSYGCMDMSGNVWEWTSSLFASYPYNNDINHEDNNSINSRVLRGGSWSHDARYARAAFRLNNAPDNLSSTRGSRVASSKQRL